MKLFRYISLLIIVLTGFQAARAAEKDAVSGLTKEERLLIKEGNKLFNEQKFHEALKSYNNALTLNPSSAVAQFNKAVTLVQLSTDDNKGTENDPRQAAAQLFKDIATAEATADLAAKAFYNLGNMAFNDSDFGTAIEMYKNSLRKVPDNRAARQNLLLAMQKQQEQQQNKQDQNQDQQEQEKEQQQQQQQQEQQQQEQQQQEQQQQQPMTQNAEQILQSMQNRENETRRNTKEQPARPAGNPTTDKPW